MLATHSSGYGGEVREGAWRRYEMLRARARAGLAEITVPPDAAGTILLLGERARLPGAAGRIEALLTR